MRAGRGMIGRPVDGWQPEETGEEIIISKICPGKRHELEGNDFDYMLSFTDEYIVRDSFFMPVLQRVCGEECTFSGLRFVLYW